MFRRIWDDWWDQNIRFGMMNQLSLPVLLDHQRCDPMQFAISLRRNDHFTKTAHQRDM
jgi:hypothetical protein